MVLVRQRPLEHYSRSVSIRDGRGLLRTFFGVAYWPKNIPGFMHKSALRSCNLRFVALALILSVSAPCLAQEGSRARKDTERLARDLQSPSEAVRVEAAKGLSDAPPNEIEKVVPTIAAGLSDKSMRVRRLCTEALKRCGPKAKGAVPQLVRALDDEDSAAVRLNSAAALVRIGPPAVQALVNHLKNVDSPGRIYSVRVLAEIGSASKSALPELRRMMQAAPPDLGLEAAHAAVRIAPEDNASLEMAVPILADCLKRGDIEERVRCAGTLSLTGKKGKVALPLLISIVTAKEPLPEDWVRAFKHSDIRYVATFYLWRFGPATGEAEPALVGILRDPRYSDAGEYRALIAAALIRVNPKSQAATRALKDLLPELISFLGEGNEDFSLAATDALGRLGPEAKIALPALKRLSQADKQELRKAAAQAIKLIEGG